MPKDSPDFKCDRALAAFSTGYFGRCSLSHRILNARTAAGIIGGFGFSDVRATGCDGEVYDFDWREGSGPDALASLAAGGAILESGFADARQLAVGDPFTMVTPSGSNGTIGSTAATLLLTLVVNKINVPGAIDVKYTRNWDRSGAISIAFR